MGVLFQISCLYCKCFINICYDKEDKGVIWLILFLNKAGNTASDMRIFVFMTMFSSKTGMIHPQMKELRYFRTRNSFIFSQLSFESFPDCTLDPSCTDMVFFTFILLVQSLSDEGEKECINSCFLGDVSRKLLLSLEELLDQKPRSKKEKL